MENWSPNPKPPAAQPSCGLVVACQIPILPHQVSRFCSPVSIATSPQNGSIYGQVEHVRLCCLLCLLYLAESGSSQRAIAQEKAESPGNLWIWGHLGRWKSDSWEICKILLSDFHIWKVIFARKALVSPNPQILNICQGVKMLLTACENETHIDLIVNALKASYFIFFLEGQAHH